MHGRLAALRVLVLSCVIGWVFVPAARAADLRWDDRFGYPGVDGSVKAVAFYDGRLYIGGDFTQAGGVPANGFACWDGRSWSDPARLATSGTVHPTVNALAVTAQGLVVGGFFTRVGEIDAVNLALWNGSSWSTLGAGPSNEVHALAVIDGQLYVGGQFKSVGATSASRIARWDGIAWSALGAGVDESERRCRGVRHRRLRRTDRGGGELRRGGRSLRPVRRPVGWRGVVGSGLGRRRHRVLGRGVRRHAVRWGDLHARRGRHRSVRGSLGRLRVGLPPPAGAQTARSGR